VSVELSGRALSAGTLAAPAPELEEDSSRARLIRILRDRYVLRILSMVAFLLLWQIIGSFLDPMFLPTPTAVAREFPGLIASGKLPAATWDSAKIFLAGFVIASVLALPGGILLGKSRTASDFFESYVTVFWATPTIALLPVLVTWFGLTVTTKLAIVFLSAFWPLLINTQTGVQNVDHTYGEVVDSFGARPLEHLWYVTIPASVPYIVAGLRIAIGRAIIGVIVAELYTSVTGLGSLMSFYSNYFETARYFASLATLVIFSVAFTEAVRLIEMRFSYWKG
jgi:ABC-type nitrate/sulfonate/bicarbonate transport system permease component